MMLSDKLVDYYVTGTLHSLMAVGLRQDEATKFCKFMRERSTLVQDAVPGALREYMERLVELEKR